MLNNNGIYEVEYLIEQLRYIRHTANILENNLKHHINQHNEQAYIDNDGDIKRRDECNAS